MRCYDDLPLKLGPLSLEGINSQNVSIANQGFHGVALYSKKTRIPGIRAPGRRSSDHLSRRNRSQTAAAVSLNSVSSDDDLQERQTDDVTRIRMCGGTRVRFVQLRHVESLARTGGTAQGFQHFGSLDASQLPEIPGFILRAEISKFDKVLGGRT